MMVILKNISSIFCKAEGFRGPKKQKLDHPEVIYETHSPGEIIVYGPVVGFEPAVDPRYPVQSPASRFDQNPPVRPPSASEI